MTDQDSIRAVIDGMFQAFLAHDPAGVDAPLHPDCTIWDLFVPQLIRGADQRAAFHEADRAQSMARGRLTLDTGDPVIDVWGDIGLARYVLTFDYQPPNALAGRVRITTVLRRAGDSWRIVHHHEGMEPTGVPDVG